MRLPEKYVEDIVLPELEGMFFKNWFQIVKNLLKFLIIEIF